MIIAIDGPAASGKTTTARLVAQKLAITYLDTGAMYRAVTLAVLESGIGLHDSAALEDLLDRLELEISPQNGPGRITLNGRDVTGPIRSSQVTTRVSAVSALPAVREAMVGIQRVLGRRQDCVVEGRDIGTVVFPEADFKFFMVADYETRARRRLKDLHELGEEGNLEAVVTELQRRDQLDSSRDHSPLRQAADAIEIDTSQLTIEEQVQLIIDTVKPRMRKN